MTETGRGARAWAGFLLHFVAVGALLPQALHWDGIGFLDWARGPGFNVDPAHFLYPSVIRLAHGLLAPTGLSLEHTARLLSAAAAAGAFVLLGTRFERGGLPVLEATLAALLVTTTHLFWLQASAVEPYTPALLAVLLAAAAADAYAARRSPTRLFLLCAAVLLALALHVVAAVALPWIVWHAHARGPLPRGHVVGAALGLLAVLLVTAGLIGWSVLARFASYGRGFFVGEASGGGFGALGQHARDLAAVLSGGASFLACLGGASALVACFAPAARGAWRDAAWLGLPHLAVFLVLGKPVVALLLPFLAALGLFLAAGLRAAARIPYAPFAARVLLPAVLAVQAAFSVLEAFHAAAAPDPRRALAEELAAELPPGGALLAGEVARHVDWWTGATVAGLPDVVHNGLAEHGPEVDRAALVGEAAERLLARAGIDSVWITSEGLLYLETIWGVAPTRVVPAGAERLRLDHGLELVLLARRPTPGS